MYNEFHKNTTHHGWIVLFQPFIKLWMKIKLWISMSMIDYMMYRTHANNMEWDWLAWSNHMKWGWSIVWLNCTFPTFYQAMNENPAMNIKEHDRLTWCMGLMQITWNETGEHEQITWNEDYEDGLVYDGWDLLVLSSITRHATSKND